MKKTILFALVWLAAVACDQKNEAVPQAELKTTSVPYRQETTVPASGENLKVDLVEITDSRCPKNVVCVQMGSAQIKFNVSDGKNQADVDVTFKGDKTAGSQVFSLGGQTYLLKVSEVLPYPDTTESPKLEDYKVSVTIEKK
jgi:hypothetical protein